MMPKETIDIAEGNKLIREFMGHGYSSIHGIYHLSWEEIMPVVEKIESNGHKTIIGGGDHWGNYCNIMFGKNSEERKKIYQETNQETKAMGQHESKIVSVWLALIDFIKWYNHQP